MFTVRVTACLCWFSCAAIASNLATAEDIYYFDDERGIGHFSNVPSDPRYQLLLRFSTPRRPDRSSNSAAVVLFAPPIVAPGNQFVVNVMFSSPASVHGWLEIGFDPVALTLRAVSMNYETPQAGRMRLLLAREQAAFSADLHFEANAQASEQTSIEVVQTSLSTVNGRSLLPSVAEIAPIAISSLVR
jgi:hypothetical protein